MSSGIVASSFSFLGPAINKFINVEYGSFVNCFTSIFLASGTNFFLSLSLKYSDTIVCLIV